MVKGVAQVVEAPGDDDAVIHAHYATHLGVDIVGLRGGQGGDRGLGDHKGRGELGCLLAKALIHQHANVAQASQQGDEMFPDPDAVYAQPLSHDHLHVQEGNPEQEEQEEV